MAGLVDIPAVVVAVTREGPVAVVMTVVVPPLVAGRVVMPVAVPVVVIVVTSPLASEDVAGGIITVTVQSVHPDVGLIVVVLDIVPVTVTVFWPGQVKTVVVPPDEAGGTVVIQGAVPLTVTVMHSWHAGAVTVLISVTVAGTTTVAEHSLQWGGGGIVIVLETVPVTVTVLRPIQVKTVVFPPSEAGGTVVT